MTTFTLTPQRSALMKGHDNEFHILAKLIAPKLPSTPISRKKLNLSIVIDRSGSMEGTPIEEAKNCAKMIINSLNSDDRVSVVAYDSVVETIVPSTKVLNKEKIISSISRIYSRGMTALYEGWLTGAEQVARHKNVNNINRVLLLSDGCANEGPSSISEIVPQCSKLAETGVTTSTYGLGQDFNEELMIAMAKSGLGKGYYGQTAQDLEDPFREEFELLANTMATNIEIFVEYPDFIKLELLNRYPGQDPKWKLPDLAYEGEAWALFKLSVLEENMKKCEKVDLLKSHITYKDLEGKLVKTPVETIRLKPVDENAFGALLENSEIKSRIAEIRAATLQDHARFAAQQGDWDGVENIILKAKNEAGENAWIQETLSNLKKYSERRDRQAFSKEASYSSDKFRNRLTHSINESPVSYDYNEEIIKPAYLRRKQEQGKKMSKGRFSSFFGGRNR